MKLARGGTGEPKTEDAYDQSRTCDREGREAQQREKAGERASAPVESGHVCHSAAEDESGLNAGRSPNFLSPSD